MFNVIVDARAAAVTGKVKYMSRLWRLKSQAGQKRYYMVYGVITHRRRQLVEFIQSNRNLSNNREKILRHREVTLRHS